MTEDTRASRDLWASLEGLPPVTGEFRTPTIDRLERARASATRIRWYIGAVVAAVGGALLTAAVYRATGAYYPFISGFAMMFVIIAGFGPTLIAALGSLVLAHFVPPVGAMFPTTASESVRLGANAILLLVASGLAGMFRRSRLATIEREARLEHTTASVREVLEGASDAIVLTDEQMRITYVNSSATEMFGYLRSEVVGRSVLSIITPESLEQMPIQMEALRSGQTIHSERRAYRADGTIIHVDISARLLSGGRLLASIRDSSDRKRELERQRSERDLLNGILATSIAGIVVVDARNEIIFANRRAESLLELRRGGEGGAQYERPVWRQVALDGAQWTRDDQPVRRVLKTNEPVFDVRFAVQWPDGHRTALSVNGAPLPDARGDVQAAVFAVNDITASLAAEEAIRQRDSQLQQITTAMPGMVHQYVLDAQGHGRFLYVSQNSQIIAGLSPEELRADAGRAWSRIHPDDVRSTQLSVLASAKSMKPWVHEFRMRDDRFDGAWRWVSGRGIPQPGPEPGSVLWNGIFIDITDRKLLEDEVRQAQRIESVGRLAGGIAHDFNNLLTVILGQAELLLMELPPESDALAGVSQIRSAAESGSMLTRQLLGFARRQVMAPQVIDVNTLAMRVPTLMGRLLGEQVTLLLELTDDPPLVRVDPSQFDQVLVNLAMNARDAMPAGGTIVLRTNRVSSIDARHPELAAFGEEPLAELSVTDSGTGMSADVRERAFEPFYTTKDVGKGTGLGLATSYGIVKQAGGTIMLESEMGAGTTVRIVLPISAEAPSTITPANIGAKPGGNETILVVDDDRAVRGVTASALRRQGYRVLEAESGAAAIAASRGESARIHLLVTDVVMPKMSGPELAVQLATERHDMRVLFVSGYAEGAVTEHGIVAEGLSMLSKPYDITELARRVRTLLDMPNGAAPGSHAPH